MILTRDQIAAAGIVVNGNERGRHRPTSYDATVKHVLVDGQIQGGAKYILPKRGMAWIISAEEFHVPCDVTGLATLRTTWTHDGVLALNVGVVDPGWQGPLTTAVVNFSGKPFEIEKGDSFLRILFLKHNPTSGPVEHVRAETYLDRIMQKSSRTGATFLNIESLAAETADQVLGFPRIGRQILTWTVLISLVALALGTLGAFGPVALSTGQEWRSRGADIKKLQEELSILKDRNAALERSVNAVLTRNASAPAASSDGQPQGQ